MDRLLVIEKIASVLFFIVFMGLAYSAIIEQNILLGSPKSPTVTHVTGTDAVLTGYGLLVVAFSAIGYLLKYSRYIRLYILIAFVAWVAIVIAFWPFYTAIE